MNESKPETVTVKRETLEGLLEDASQLLGEWAWKRGTTRQNELSLERVEQDISDARKALE